MDYPIPPSNVCLTRRFDSVSQRCDSLCGMTPPVFKDRLRESESVDCTNEETWPHAGSFQLVVHQDSQVSKMNLSHICLSSLSVSIIYQLNSIYTFNHIYLLIWPECFSRIWMQTCGICNFHQNQLMETSATDDHTSTQKGAR